MNPYIHPVDPERVATELPTGRRLLVNAERILDTRERRKRVRDQPAKYKHVLDMSEQEPNSNGNGAYIDRLHCTTLCQDSCLR